MDKLILIFIETAKATAIEMIKSGVAPMEVAMQMAAKFDNAIARLIMVDIMIDLGRIEESKKYLANF